ncbi:hypothetical protein TUA1478L_04170 [Lactiplantibacillus plantarum]
MIDRVDNNHFDLVSDYQPTGDQPQAIQQLTAGIESGEKEQILLGRPGPGRPLQFRT